MPDSKELIKIDPQVIHNLHNIKKEKFIEFYCQDEVRGNVSVACAATGIDRGTYYDWLVADEEFKKIITDAKMQMCDDMEQVLIHRAIDKSDTALIYWLKYNHPQYKEVPQFMQQVNVTGKNEIEFVNFKDVAESQPSI